MIVVQRRNVIWAVLFLGVLVAGAIWVHDPFDFDPKEDAKQYHQLAVNIVMNGTYSLDEAPPYSSSDRRPPGYPAFLAMIYQIFDTDVRAAKFVQVLLVPVIGWFTYLVALSLTRSCAAANIAALVAMLNPAFLWAANRLLTEALMTAVLMAAVCLLLAWHKSRSVSSALMIGVLCGFLGLVKPEAVLSGAFVAASMLVTEGERPERIRSAALVIIAVVIVNAPWMYRSQILLPRLNASVSQETPADQRVGLLREYRLRAEHGLFLRPERYKYVYGSDWKSAQATYDMALASDVSDPGTSDIQYFLNEPLLMVKFLPLKFIGLFRPSSWSAVYGVEDDFSSLIETRNFVAFSVKSLLFTLDAAISLVGILGMLYLVNSTVSSRWLLISLPSYFIFVYTAIHGITRYRIPFVALLVVFATYFVCRALHMMSARNGSLAPHTNE